MSRSAKDRLGELATFLSGGTPSKSDLSYWNGSIPWLTPKDMGQWSGTTESFVTETALGNGTRLAPPNAIFIAVRGMSLHNEIRIIAPKVAMSFNQDIKAIIPKEGIDPNYLFYAITSKKYELLGAVEAAGHGTGRLPTDRLLSLEVSRYSSAEEAEIGKLFAALDDKIELNRRMNETLEAMARAIFRDWFVDFGPTRAKQEARSAGGTTGNANTAGREPYLAPEIWSLFPDRLDADGKPEGWESATLGQITSELRRGVSPSYVLSGGVRVLNQKCVRNRQVDPGPSRRHDLEKRSVEGREVNVGDVLVNSTGVGTLGRVAQLWEIDEPTIVDSHVTVVRANPKFVSTCYFGLNLTGREPEIEALGEGSTGQTELARARLATLSVLLPSAVLQSEFDNTARSLLDRMVANARESRILAALRDLLLPKLMSGEIRVRDAQKFAEEAA